MTQFAVLYLLLRLGVDRSPRTPCRRLATIVAYVGNRDYSFSHRAASGFAREATTFLVVNAIAFALSESWWFWCYKRFVFLKPQTSG